MSSAPRTPPRTPPKCNPFLSIREKWDKRDTTTTTTALEPVAAYPFSPQKSKKKKKKRLPKFSTSGLCDGAAEQKSPAGRSKSFGQAYSSNSPLRRAESFGEAQSVGSSSIPKPPAFGRCMSLPCSSKSVRFGHQNQVRDIETIEELSESLILSLWWSEREYIEMRQDWETVLYLLESGKPVCEETLSSRGLHKRTDSGAWGLYECQRDARNAVFEVQERQRKEKRTDPYEISLAYLQRTAKSQVEALEQGAVDAKSVDKFKRKKSKKYGSQSPKKNTQSSKKSPKPKNPSKMKSTPRPVMLQDSFFMKDPNSPVPSPKPNQKVVIVRPSQTVQFNNELTFIKTKKVKDMDKAIKRRWLSERELQSIAKGFKSTVKLIENGIEVEETEDQTVRGLEHSTKEGQKKLAQQRQKVLDTVLKTQENGSALQNVLDNILQIKEKSKTFDVETLAEAYRNATADDARRAVKQGKHDARDAKRSRMRRRSIQGCLSQKLNAESKGVVPRDTPSIATDESSVNVEPEFVRLAKKRRERRASISDSRSFRQNHRKIDIAPDSMIEDSIAKVHSADKAGRAENPVQVREGERTPTPPQNRWCRLGQPATIGANGVKCRSPKTQKTVVAYNSPRAFVGASSKSSLENQEKADDQLDTETSTKPQETETRTKGSGSFPCINANPLVCPKEAKQLPVTPVFVATPALSTTLEEDALCNSSTSPSSEFTSIHPPFVAATSKSGEPGASPPLCYSSTSPKSECTSIHPPFVAATSKSGKPGAPPTLCNSSSSPSSEFTSIHPPFVTATSKSGEPGAPPHAGDLTSDEAEPKLPVPTTAVVDLNDQQRSTEEKNQPLDYMQIPESSQGDKQCHGCVVPSTLAGDLGKEKHCNLENGDDEGTAEFTKTKVDVAKTVEPLSLPSEINVQVGASIDDSDTESVCTRASVTVLASKFNLPRTISSDSRVSSCSGMSQLRASEALVRNVSGTSSIASYLETISRTSKSSDSKFEAPPIPKRIFRPPRATPDDPTKSSPGPVSTKDSFSLSSGLPPKGESEGGSPSVDVKAKSLNHGEAGAEDSCVTEIKEPTSPCGMAENADSCQGNARPVGEPQVPNTLVKDDNTADQHPGIKPDAVNHNAPMSMTTGGAVSAQQTSGANELPPVARETQIADRLNHERIDQVCDSFSTPASNEDQNRCCAHQNNVPQEGKGDITALQQELDVDVTESLSGAGEIQHSRASQAVNPIFVQPSQIAVPGAAKLVPETLAAREAQTIVAPPQESSGQSINPDRCQQLSIATEPRLQSLVREQGILRSTALAREDVEESPNPYHVQTLPVVANPQLPIVHATSAPIREEPTVSLNPTLVQPLPLAVTELTTLPPSAAAEVGQQSLDVPTQSMVWLQVRQSDLVPIPSADGRTMYLILACQQRQIINPSPSNPL